MWMDLIPTKDRYVDGPAVFSCEIGVPNVFVRAWYTCSYPMTTCRKYM